MSTFHSSKGWKSKELAKAYFHNSELQRQCVWDLMGSHPFKGNESVLDFGCRDGKIAAEISHFVKKGKVTAVDHSEALLHLAKLYFPDFEFPNLEFSLIHSLVFDDHPKELSYDRIVSFYVFHLVTDHLQILKNLHRHLKEKGEIFMIIPAQGNSNLNKAGLETLEKFQLSLPVTYPTMSRTYEWAQEVFTQAGFKIKKLDFIERPCILADSQEMIHWMIGTFTALMDVPANLTKLFYHEMFNRWVEIDPSVIDSEGRVYFPFNRYNVVATK